MDSTKVNPEEFLEIIPKVMRYIRREVSTHPSLELSLPHFRILGMIRYQSPHATNKQLAEWMGVSVAAMSRMIDGLVKRGWVLRETAPTDRRMVKLGLTEKGLEAHSRVLSALKQKLRQRIDTLDPEQRDSLSAGLHALRELFHDKD